MSAKFKILIAAFVSLVFVLFIALAWPGKFDGASKADTISFMHEGKVERIRLSGIDCPVKRQSFGSAARMNFRLPANVRNPAV